MAPIKKRTGMRAKIASKSRPAPASSSLAAASAATSSFDPETDSPSEFASFAPSKKDKRTIKHSAFVSKIEKSQKSKKRSRGASKKLQTQLEGLASALPEIQNRQGDDDEDEDDDWEGMSEDDLPSTSTATPTTTSGKEGDMLDALAGMVNIRPSIKKLNRSEDGDGKMKMTTLKSNRGQAKRKHKLEKKETERFAKNLAEMSKGPAVAPSTTTAQAGPGVQGDRWAALRGFIGQTMEKNPNFGKAP